MALRRTRHLQQLLTVFLLILTHWPTGHQLLLMKQRQVWYQQRVSTLRWLEQRRAGHPEVPMTKCSLRSRPVRISIYFFNCIHTRGKRQRIN